MYINFTNMHAMIRGHDLLSTFLNRRQLSATWRSSWKVLKESRTAPDHRYNVGCLSHNNSLDSEWKVPVVCMWRLFTYLRYLWTGLDGSWKNWEEKMKLKLPVKFPGKLIWEDKPLLVLNYCFLRPLLTAANRTNNKRGIVYQDNSNWKTSLLWLVSFFHGKITR